MANKLEDFRLLSYQERQAIYYALAYVPKEKQWPFAAEFEAISGRLSDTECQPGGCSFCGGPLEHECADT